MVHKNAAQSHVCSNSTERFIRACRLKPVDRPPVWIMRQAGRTLPEYMEIREKHTFWEICRNPELAAIVTLQPLKRFPLDAAIIFNDILTIPSAMGIDVSFKPKLTLKPAISRASQIDQLVVKNIHSSLGYVGQVIRIVQNELDGKHAVLGFSGAPYTVACYMIDGGSSRDFAKTRSLMYGEPKIFVRLLDKLATVIADYLEMQIESSATAVQIFDTWAGDVNQTDYKRYIFPSVAKVIDRISKYGVPVIYYVNGIGNILEDVHATGANVLGIDWRTSLKDVRNRTGNTVAVQGNLDPVYLLTSRERIEQRVFEMLDETNGWGHIVNLGHGILPQTPLENITCFIESIRRWTAQNHDRD